MTIAVIGAGGVGSFYGALLARAGHDVRFLARGPQLEALRSRGLHVSSTSLGELDLPRLAATGRAAEIGRADLVLVCVKAHQTAAVLDDVAAMIDDGTVVVPLQNGAETDEMLAGRFGWRHVVTAVVYVGATLEQPGLVRHVANGLIVLGARQGFDAARLPAVQQALASTGLPVRIAEDIQEERWRKLLWNASFNPVSAIAGRTPRELLGVADARVLVTGLMREVVAVARAQGLALDEGEVDAQIAWTERTPAITTSMLVDRERGRVMETEALVGIVVRKGREHAVPTPMSDAIYALLKAIDPR